MRSSPLQRIEKARLFCRYLRRELLFDQHLSFSSSSNPRRNVYRTAFTFVLSASPMQMMGCGSSRDSLDT